MPLEYDIKSADTSLILTCQPMELQKLECETKETGSFAVFFEEAMFPTLENWNSKKHAHFWSPTCFPNVKDIHQSVAGVQSYFLSKFVQTVSCPDEVITQYFHIISKLTVIYKPWKPSPLNFRWSRYIGIHERKSVIEKGDNILLSLYELSRVYIFRAVKWSEHRHAAGEFSCPWPVHLFSSTTCGGASGPLLGKLLVCMNKNAFPLAVLPYQLQVKLGRPRLKRTPQDSAEPLAWGCEDEPPLDSRREGRKWIMVLGKHKG